MAIKGQQVIVQFTAWDTDANVGKTGDAGNITAKVVKDGTIGAPNSGSVAEVDATNAPGLYKITLDETDMDANFVTLCGVSSTGNVSIIPVHIATEQGVLATIDGLIDDIKAVTDTLTQLVQRAEPDNAGIGTIQAVTDTLTQLVQRSEPDNANIALIKTAADAIQGVTDTLTQLVQRSEPATAEAIADQVWNEPLADHSGEEDSTAEKLASIISMGGVGATSKTILIKNANSIPLIGAGVWLTTDVGGTSVVAGTLYTNDSGEVDFMVDVGSTYYVWCGSADANFTNPRKWTVT